MTLALGLGASTATFSLIKNRLLRQLSYANGLLQIAAESPLRELHEADVSLPRFEQIRAQQDVFVDLAALAGKRLTILRGDVAEQINVARVSDRFFRMLAVQPLRGRLFLPLENQAGGERVVLSSYGCWQTRFSGDLNIIGRSITLEDARTTIVGVLPRNFAVPFGDFDIYLPGVSGVTFLDEEQMQRGAGFLKVIARPRPTVSLEQVRATLAAIDRRYRERAGENMDGNAVSRALPLRETVVRQARPRSMPSPRR